MNEIAAYLKNIQRQLAAADTTEHSHRPALKQLMEALIKGATATNEPRQIECGAPDFVLTRKQIPFGYIEAKDIDKDLNDKTHKEQLKRYRDSLDNLLFTNYLTFRLYREGDENREITIAEIRNGKVVAKRENFDAFSNLIKTFAGYNGQTIVSTNELAKHMAHKARLLAHTIAKAFIQDKRQGISSSELQQQFKTFRKNLIHDLETDEFADIYAQTVAYGMFAARLHDQNLQTFTRAEAAELIPETNPFLRKFFQHIAGYDLDKRIRWSVNELAELFRATDVGELMKNYGRATQHNDPFIHFYETFLGEYAPDIRRKRGVYYTPEPVVDFIVRAVDDILTTEFKLSDGLAHTGKTTIEVDATTPRANGKMPKVKKEVHKVQILDPATGTGTFLAAIVKQIYGKFAAKKGVWADYARDDLIPRLNGFEVLMASYAMAHTKLEMVLRDTGCEIGDQRLRVYLTNSLEEHHPDTDTIFAHWLATEANEANRIKRDAPVMVVIGNPPYKSESSNKGAWISALLGEYKQEPGGGKLKEKNAKWINDDYVKFIRYGQHYVDRTGEGVLAYINNHSFLDNPTFRGMRWSLLKSFDKIYIIDLHGNSKKIETSPDGSLDQNVFDIQQGVSINLFVKTGEKGEGELSKVFHYDLYGTRQSKYDVLWENDFRKLKFQELTPQKNSYFFVPKDFELQIAYEGGFSINELFISNGTGIVTKRDKLSIHFSKEDAMQAARDILQMDKVDFYKKYNLPDDVRDWKYQWAKDDISSSRITPKIIQPINYRIFDSRNVVYTGRSRGFIGWPVVKIMRHFLVGENVGIISAKKQSDPKKWNNIFISDKINEGHFRVDINYTFPLYLYSNGEQLCIDEPHTRKPNLNESIVKTIAEKLGLRFTPEKETDDKTFAPIDLLDYIYAVLHSPSYRERYIEFLKIDFPRVPYPSDKKLFWNMVKLGSELRAVHLLESEKLNTPTTDYPNSGDNKVVKPEFEITDAKNRIGEVKINNIQHFGGVAESAWNFYIGGYQPAQKWLKDRKGRTLNHDDITHYQKIIVALCETERLMTQIDEVFAPHIS